MIVTPTSLPTLNTRRLSLRSVRETDLIDIFSYASDPEVTTFLSWQTHETIEDSRRFLNSVLMADESESPSTWALELSESGKMIGTIGFHNWSMANDSTEIGYVIGQPWWGLGLMTEAVEAVLAHLFEELGLHRVTAICSKNNFASERILQKVGMRLEGLFTSSHLIKDEYHDMKTYAILRDEWLRNQTKAADHRNASAS